MRKLLHKIIAITVLFVLVTLTVGAQLANWSQKSGAQFPTNLVGQINGMTRIVQLKHHVSDTNKMYAVTAEGGLFTTSDKGNNWTVKAGTENLTGSCASICIDYTNDQTILLGSGDPNYYSNGSGILKSTDGGNTFNTTNLTNALVVHIIQNPLNSSEYIAATNKGIYKSTNSGSTWTAKTVTTLQFVDVRMNPGTNSQTLYACTKDNNSRLFKSINFGETWTELLPGFTYPATYTTGGARIGLTIADTNVVYFEMIGGGGMIYKSNDGGATFNLKKAEGVPYINFYEQTGPSSSGLTGQGNYNNCLWVDRTNPAKIWLQSHNTWYSTDSGATWTMLTFWSQKIHTDMHQLEQAPFNNNLLISCNDGGIWFSTDGGNNWTQKTNGIGAFEIANNAGISAMNDKDFVSIGTQDNARLYGTAAGWFTISGGDDYAKRVADFNGNIYFDGNKRQANLTGSSATYGLPTANWNTFGFNRTDKELGFMGVNDVWRSTNLSNSTPTWTQISSFATAIQSIHSCIADPNRLYVLLQNGDIYVSTNALAATPTFTLYGIPGSASSTGSVVAMANNADIVYVQENNKVYRSVDGGQNWTDVSYNLPNVNHRRILTEQYGGATELVLVATNNAVYYKKAGQTTWTNYSTNLPGRRAPTDFSMYDDGTNNSKIRYATYGRSMWETPFGNLRSLNCSFDANMVFSCTTGTPILFNDKSIGNPTSWSWSFPGGTPATSNSQNPTVTYNSSGLYSVTLTISDGVTSSSFTRTNYILVLSGAPTTNTGCSITSNSNLNNGFGIGISNFSLENINSQTPSNNGQYNDYTCSQYTILTAGNTYNATVSTGTTNAEGAALYIDLNDNGIFESGELLTSYPSNTSGTRTQVITIPSSGVTLNKGLRLRILSRFGQIPTSACNVSTYGQAEDYTVYIKSPSTAILANGSGSSSICSGTTANVQVNINGGVSPYTVVISDGTNSQTTTNYTSGSSIIVTPSVTSTYSIVSVLDFGNNVIPGSGSATVTVTPSTGAKTVASACDSYLWSANGMTYTTGGTYFDTQGCKTDTLQLTINTGTFSASTVNACSSYLWNGTTYTVGGTYTYNYTNVNGCLSTDTLHLTINNSSTNVTTQTVCFSYTWPVTGQTYTATGVYAGPTINCVTEELNLTVLGGHMVLATAGNATSTPGTNASTNTLSNNTILFESGCDYAAEITDGPSGAGAGVTSLSVTVDGSNPIGPNGQVYAPRHFNVNATNNESGSVVLYATQDDFNDYNAASGSLLSMTAGTVKVAQAIGGLSGTVNPVSSTATWNATLSRYEISCGVSVLNAEYYLYTEPACTLAMSTITPSNLTINSGTLSWTPVAGAANYEIRFRVQGSLTWSMTSLTGSTKVINGCLPGTTYEFQGKVRCSSTTSGLWGPIGTFTTLPSLCQPATNLAAGNITPSAATITWNAMPSAISYVLRYRSVIPANSSWIGVGSNYSTSRLLQGLTSGTTYEIQIATFCSSTNSLSAFSASIQFTTLSNPCLAPANIAAIPTSTTAILSWDAVPVASSYIMRYRPSATSPNGIWINSGCATNSKVLANLTSNTSYDVEIKTICNASATSSNYSNFSFSTNSQLKPFEGDVNFETLTNSSRIQIYPNPTSELINIELMAIEPQTTTVKVYDLTGRLMKQVVSQTEAGTQKVEVSLGEIASGVYTVQVYENEKLTHISRVRKND